MSKQTIALLPGSYDPITLGHMDIITRAAALFDQVVVAVMTNDMANYAPGASSKTYRFSMQERVDMATLACRDMANVRVISSTARLIDLFDEIEATAIVKGVRSETDFTYEQKHALWNRAHNRRAETLYLPADPALEGVSSTLVRQYLEEKRTLDGLVPDAVATMLNRTEG